MDSPAADAFLRISAYLYYIFGQWHNLFIFWMFWYRIVIPLKHTVLCRVTYVFGAVQVLVTLMILTAPLTGFVYRIAHHSVYANTCGHRLWMSIAMLTFLMIGGALTIFWKQIETDYRGCIAMAVFLPAFGFFISLLTGFNITNSLASVTMVIIFWLHLYRKAKVAVHNAYELSLARMLLA